MCVSVCVWGGTASYTSRGLRVCVFVGGHCLLLPRLQAASGPRSSFASIRHTLVRWL